MLTKEDPVSCVTWLIHDSFICVTWFIHMCDMTHPHVWQNKVLSGLNRVVSEIVDEREGLLLRQLRMSQITRERVMSHTNQSCHTYESVMSHIWIGHVTHVDESCHTYEWVISHIRMSHVTHINESCHTYEWVMSHIWMSHVKHMNESCHTHEWVMLHIWMGNVTYMN